MTNRRSRYFMYNLPIIQEICRASFFLLPDAVFRLLIYLFKKVAYMELSSLEKNNLMRVPQQQAAPLKPNSSQDLSSDDNVENNNEIENFLLAVAKRLNWVQALLAFAVLLVLLVFICQIFIYRHINMERNKQFLDNLQLLKASKVLKPQQPKIKIKPKIETLQTKQNSASKLAAYTKKPVKIQMQDKDKKSNQLRQTPSKAIQKKDGQQFPKANQHENTVKNNLLLAHKRRSQTIFGSGISQYTLQRARQRLILLNEDVNISSKVSQQQIRYYQDKYRVGNYKQLPICVVVPTYNNAPNNRYLDNIKSIVMQNYSNYHIVVIDDASDDNTGLLILTYLQRQSMVTPDRYSVIRNTEQMHTMFNLRLAAKDYCKPNDIFLVIDGDDYLVGRQVFKLYSAKFQRDDLWFMYTNFISAQGKIGYSRPFPYAIIEANKYRDYPFVTSHLRAFYTKLFLNIKQADLRDQKGQYLRAANDVAICLPILQQAHLHIQYVPQITYFYNSNTGLNNHAIRLQEQKSNDRKIRRRSRYPQVKSIN